MLDTFYQKASCTRVHSQIAQAGDLQQENTNRPSARLRLAGHVQVTGTSQIPNYTTAGHDMQGSSEKLPPLPCYECCAYCCTLAVSQSLAFDTGMQIMHACYQEAFLF